MVGTAYPRARARRASLRRGRRRGEGGQTLLIIEAMKTMNQIPAPRAGTVTESWSRMASRSNIGEPLMIIE